MTASRIVGIHGINQHRKIPKELHRAWRNGIKAGLRAVRADAPDDFDFTLVYYADVLEERRADWKGYGDEQIDAAREPEVAELVVEWLTALENSAAPGARKGDRVGIPPTPRSVQWAVQRLAASPALQGLGEGGVRRLARHMHAYLAHDEARAAVQRRVDEQAGSEPITLLIGHSMGSVVAYEWLCREGGGRARTLLTLGSPLGSAPVVRRILPPPDAPGQGESDGGFPWRDTLWWNAAGLRDPIAWPKRLASVFGTRVHDVVVPTRLNAHGARTYLRSGAVGDLVTRCLDPGSDPEGDR
ncbi:hypothetical protein [Streptosporangium sp. NPDC002721]|uniref:hypothetical protein n=1 Tax=Streptosporangium sp. NPDC002721 TaxID=3366188 RepID=UPI00369C062B